jgi:hypothetical protein
VILPGSPTLLPASSDGSRPNSGQVLRHFDSRQDEVILVSQWLSARLGTSFLVVGAMTRAGFGVSTWYARAFEEA